MGGVTGSEVGWILGDNVEGVIGNTIGLKVGAKVRAKVRTTELKVSKVGLELDPIFILI